MYNGIVITDEMLNGKSYDGNTLKYGITVNGIDYIVKFPKETNSSIYSEYIASNFIKALGVDCQNVWIGYYKGTLVNVIEDFAVNGKTLKSYKSTKQSYEGTDISNKTYTYTDVLYMIKKHKKLTEYDKQQMLIRFWDMFICDAILGNRDRHWGNWGYISYKGKYYPAPLYDNGASLFPDVERRIKEYTINTEYIFIKERSEKFPASLFRMEREDGEIKRTNYYEMLSDLRFNRILAQEVKKIKEKVGFSRIYELAFRVVTSSNDIIQPIYRRFYLMIICVRYLHIVERKPIDKAYKMTRKRLEDEVRQL